MQAPQEIKSTIEQEKVRQFCEVIIIGDLNQAKELYVQFIEKPKIEQEKSPGHSDACELIHTVHPELQITPIQIALLQENAQVVEWLIEKGANLNSKYCLPILIPVSDTLWDILAKYPDQILPEEVGTFIQHPKVWDLLNKKRSNPDNLKLQTTKARIFLYYGILGLIFLKRLSPEKQAEYLPRVNRYLKEAYKQFILLKDEANQATASYYLGILYAEPLLKNVNNAEKLQPHLWFNAAINFYHQQQLPLFRAIIHFYQLNNEIYTPSRKDQEKLTALQFIDNFITRDKVLKIEQRIKTLQLFQEAWLYFEELRNTKESTAIVENIDESIELFQIALREYFQCKDDSILATKFAFETHFLSLLEVYEFFSDLILKNINEIEQRPWCEFCINMLDILAGLDATTLATARTKKINKIQTDAERLDDRHVLLDEEIAAKPTEQLLFIMQLCDSVCFAFNYGLNEYYSDIQSLYKLICRPIINSIMKIGEFQNDKLKYQIEAEKISKTFNASCHISRKINLVWDGQGSSQLIMIVRSLVKYAAFFMSGIPNHIHAFYLHDLNELTLDFTPQELSEDKKHVKKAPAVASVVYNKQIYPCIQAAFLALQLAIDKNLSNTPMPEDAVLSTVYAIIEHGVEGIKIPGTFTYHNEAQFSFGPKRKKELNNHFIKCLSQESYLFSRYIEIVNLLSGAISKSALSLTEDTLNTLGQYLFFYKQFLSRSDFQDSKLYDLLVTPIKFRKQLDNSTSQQFEIKYGILLVRHIQLVYAWAKDQDSEKLKELEKIFSKIKTVPAFKPLLEKSSKIVTFSNFLAAMRTSDKIAEVKRIGFDIIIKFKDTQLADAFHKTLAAVWDEKKPDVTLMGASVAIKRCYAIPQKQWEVFTKKYKLTIPQPIQHPLADIKLVSNEVKPKPTTTHTESTQAKFKEKPVVGSGFWANSDINADSDNEDEVVYLSPQLTQFLSPSISRLHTPSEPATPMEADSAETKAYVFNLNSLVTALQDLEGSSWRTPISSLAFTPDAVKFLYESNKKLFDEIQDCFSELAAAEAQNNKKAVLLRMVLIAVKLKEISFDKFQTPFVILEQVDDLRNLICDRLDLFISESNPHYFENLKEIYQLIHVYVDCIINQTIALDKIFIINLAKHPELGQISVAISDDLKKDLDLTIQPMLASMQDIEEDQSFPNVVMTLVHLGRSIRILRDHHNNVCNQYFKSRLGITEYSAVFKAFAISLGVDFSKQPKNIRILSLIDFKDEAMVEQYAHAVKDKFGNLLLQLMEFGNVVCHELDFCEEKYSNWVKIMVNELLPALHEVLALIQSLSGAPDNPGKMEESVEQSTQQLRFG